MTATSPAGEARVLDARELTTSIWLAGWSYRSLADHLTARGISTSPATIGHLCTGHVKATSARRAAAIAEAVERPSADLFAPEVSTVKADTSREGAA